MTESEDARQSITPTSAASRYFAPAPPPPPPLVLPLTVLASHRRRLLKTCVCGHSASPSCLSPPFTPLSTPSLYPHIFPGHSLRDLEERLSSPAAAKRGLFSAFWAEKLLLVRAIIVQFTQAFRWRKLQNGRRFLWLHSLLITHITFPMSARHTMRPRI